MDDPEVIIPTATVKPHRCSLPLSLG